MNRKQFIEAQGATCVNWTWSWSFINRRRKFIIFGAWDTGLMEDGSTEIFSEEWETRRGRKQKAYSQSREHIRLIEEKGYKLFTFPIIRANPKAKDEPAIIERFDTELEESWLLRNGSSWYAVPKSQQKISKSSRNPAWSRDELILALDLYFREPGARGNKSHLEVIKLSKELNLLPIHPGAQGQSFRNPNGVAMKLSNFLKYDPKYKGKGLERGSILEKEVWEQFSEDRERLSAVVDAMRANSVALVKFDSLEESAEEDEEASEGKILSRIHKYRERDRKIVKKKKNSVLSRFGNLKCEVCNFDFAEEYGDRGEGFAECHHKIPVSELDPGHKTKLSDLAILCANCHRMIHISKPWLTLSELKKIFKP